MLTAAVKAGRVAHQARLRRLTDSLKARPCADCGRSYPPYVMDFDHLDPSTKRLAVAFMVVGRYSEESIRSEVAKCALVCANCHRERTHRRRIA